LEEKQEWLESGNKSGKEGDLDEMSVALRQIMFDLEDQEAEKQRKEDLKKDLDAKETAITSGQVQNEISKKAGLSRGKRKAGDMSGLTSSSSDSSPADAHAFLDEFIFRGTRIITLLSSPSPSQSSSSSPTPRSRGANGGGAKASSVPKVPTSRTRLEKMLTSFQEWKQRLGSEEQVLTELANELRLERHGVCSDLAMITFDVMCTDYVMATDKQQFVNGLKEYGLTLLEASKIYAYLFKLEATPRAITCQTPQEKTDVFEVHDV
jgi:hypothetical protein